MLDRGGRDDAMDQTVTGQSQHETTQDSPADSSKKRQQRFPGKKPTRSAIFRYGAFDDRNERGEATEQQKSLLCGIFS
jgi:hypothetical protein